MTWFLHHRFAILLVSILLLFVGFPLTRGFVAAHLAYNILYTAVFVCAILGFVRRRRRRQFAVLLGVPALAVTWFGQRVPGVSPILVAVLFHVLTTAFLAFVVTTVLMSIYHQDRITGDSVCGAFAGYLLVGVAFGHVYALIERVDPDAFWSTNNARQQMQADDRRFFMLTYFSFVTLTTVGYGEIAPSSEIARALCAVEAIIGQFYIAVLVADLIGKKLSHAVGRPDLSRPPADHSDG